MKVSRIVVFILAVLGGLAVLCHVFPREGITYAGLHLELPSIAEILTSAEEENPEAEIDPEELLTQRLAEQKHAAREQEYLDFHQTSPTRISMPNGNGADYLDPFFRLLDSAGEKRVRVMHYGDSQLEVDRMTSALRQHLQEQYGGHGVGLRAAGFSKYTLTSSMTTSPDSIPIHLAFGPWPRSGNGRYGPMGIVGHVYGRMSISLQSAGSKDFPNAQGYSRVGVLMRGGEATVTADGVTYTLLAANTDTEPRQEQQITPNTDAEPQQEQQITPNTGAEPQQEQQIAPNTDAEPQQEVQIATNTDAEAQRVRFVAVNLPKAAGRVTFNLHGPAELYCITAEDTVGVTVDNINMRGSSGTLFTSIDGSTMKPFFDAEPVGLIILQYGGNSMPVLKTPEQISSYMTSVRKQIRVFQELAPKACILWIGPSDMATNVRGSMQTYPALPMVVDSLRNAVTESGAAYWDLYAAMGGHNSMVRFVNSSPQLAGEDYVHFTPKGARKMGEILCEAINFYYRYYRLRHHPESIDEYETENNEGRPTDSLRTDSVQ